MNRQKIYLAKVQNVVVKLNQLNTKNILKEGKMRTIETRKVSISLTPEILERVEAYGKKVGISRATAISVLVSKALEQEEMQETIKNGYVRLSKSVNVLAESTDMPISLSFGMNPRRNTNAIPTNDT